MESGQPVKIYIFFSFGILLYLNTESFLFYLSDDGVVKKDLSTMEKVLVVDRTFVVGVLCMQ